jgi:hypothetical protein
MIKKNAPDKITLERVFSNISLLSYSISFLIIGAILVNLNAISGGFTLKAYLGLGFLMLSFFLFLQLLVDISVYYLSNSWNWFKVTYEDYKWYYYFSIAGLALLGLIYLGATKLSDETFWTIIVSTGITIVVGVIGFGIRKKLGFK